MSVPVGIPIGTPSLCGERRPFTAARCEMPADHIVGRKSDPPGRHDPWHCGRDRAGRWHSWLSKPAENQYEVWWETGCWVWTGGRNSDGYGHVWVYDLGRTVDVHRWHYEQYVGPIPDGLEIDHLCCVKACCNPAHLEAVTRSENLRRRYALRNAPRQVTPPVGGWLSVRNANREKTHCKRGHEFTEANTYRHPTTHARVCRECRRLRSRGATV